MRRRGEFWRTDGSQPSGGDLRLGNFPAAIICVSSNENWWQFELIADAVRTWHMVALISSATGAALLKSPNLHCQSSEERLGSSCMEGWGCGRREGKCEWIQTRPKLTCGALKLAVTLYKVLFFHWIIFSVLTLIKKKKSFNLDVVCFQWLRGIIRQLLAKCIPYSRNRLCFEVFLCQGFLVPLIRKCSTWQPLTSSSSRSVA